MTLSLYFDQHVPRAIAVELRRRGVDVLTTQEDGTELWDDEHLLERATALGRIMVSEDKDYASLAKRWLSEGRSFAGIVRGKDLKHNIGRAIEDLQIVAECYTADEMVNRIIYVPL
jgi:predicted nuclease of predicted toxin-antitoxin system